MDHIIESEDYADNRKGVIKVRTSFTLPPRSTNIRGEARDEESGTTTGICYNLCQMSNGCKFEITIS